MRSNKRHGYWNILVVGASLGGVRSLAHDEDERERDLPHDERLPHAAALLVVASDHGQLAQHGEAVSQDADFRARLVGPVHRDLRNAVSALLGQIQQFEIEAESID